jgi:DNA-binding XRE family transcriptional regulator
VRLQAGKQRPAFQVVANTRGMVAAPPVEEGESRIMHPAELRAARELLGLTQEQLADMADLSLSTIQDFELGRAIQSCLVATIRVALEAAGIEFACGESVRLRKDATS